MHHKTALIYRIECDIAHASGKPKRTFGVEKQIDCRAGNQRL